MSKRTKVSPVADDYSLQDFPPEIIRNIASFSNTGSTRRGLSGSNVYFNSVLGNISNEQRLDELKNTQLEYYNSKEFTTHPEDFDKTFYVDIKGKSIRINPYRNVRNRTMEFSINVGVPILGTENYENDIHTPLALRPVGDFPEIVRVVMAFIFHTYYTSTQPLLPTLRIHFFFFQNSFFSSVHLSWSSFDTFLENNAYSTLLNSLLEKYEPLQYLNNLPTVPTLMCTDSMGDYYEEHIELFQKENSVKIYDGIDPQQKNSFYFSLILQRTKEEMRGSCYLDKGDNLIFKFDYKVAQKDIHYGSLVDTSTMTDEILKIIHMLLPRCERIMDKQFSGSILVYLEFSLPNGIENKMPYYFFLPVDSYLCVESYQYLYPYIKNFIEYSMGIFIDNRIYTLSIRDDLSTEVLRNHSVFDSLSQYRG